MRHLPGSNSAARWICLAIALSLCTGLWAQDGEKEALEGRRIERIDVDVPADVDATRVREVIRARVGDTYTLKAVEADVAALFGLGEYTGIRVERKRLGEGVHLTYRMKRRAVIHSIGFEGDVKFSEDDLRNALDVSVGEPMVPYRLKLSIENLRSHYRDAGYVFAHVEERKTETDEGVELVYRISAGAMLNVEAVQFEGNEAISDRNLRKLMGSMKPGGLFGKGRYQPEFLRSDLLTVGEQFRRKGYLDATVGHEIVYDEAKERAYVLIRVRQGTLYTVERIVIRGAELFTTAEVAAVMTLAEGSAFSQEVIDADLREIGRLYGRKGHVKAQTTVDRIFSEEAPSVTLRLTIAEGSKYTVNHVKIIGIDLTNDNVVRRDVTLLPGDVANTDEIDETRRRLNDTGLFFAGRQETAGKDPVVISLLDTDDPTKIDVLIELIEGRMGLLEVGAGWSSSVGIVGNLTISHRNFDPMDLPTSWRDLLRGNAFVGAGQRLVLSLSPGADYRDFRLSWLDPSIFDSPYRVGFDLYLRDYEWSTADYDESRVGVALRLGRRFMEDLVVTVVPRFENIEISGVGAGASTDAMAAVGDHTRRSITVIADYDKRDSRFFTTTGYRLYGSLERGGALLGGDLDYLREIIEARRWWTVRDQPGWGKHVLNVGGEIGMIQDTGSDDILIFDRFFAGGLGSVRGFEHRGIGPVDPVTGDHIGGEYKITFNSEYEFPLAKDTLWDSQNAVRGVVFVDAGVLELTFSDLSLSRLRVSAGAGIRLRLPVFGLQKVPMGFYVAVPISDESTDETESFSFSIGTGFEF